VCVVEHVAFEGPEAIEPWLLSRGAAVRRVALHARERLPGLDEFDALVVMGGPMGVHDGDGHPWLAQERELIGQAVRAERPVLGVCLGAQQMASALGARVAPGPGREIGWWPVRAEDAGGAVGLADGATVFHWHGDQFDLPPGARPVASSPICPCQGFLWGRRALGLQFHLETTPQGLDALIAHGADDLAGAGTGHVQLPADMKRDARRHCDDLHRVLDAALHFWIGDLLPAPLPEQG